MPMRVCAGCGRHYRSQNVDGIAIRTCPHCDTAHSPSASTRAALLLGLALGAPGCVVVEPEYGATITLKPDSADTADTGGETVTTPDDSGDTGL